MAIDLMALEPQHISRDLRGKFMLLYGPAGVGKTTLASQFDDVLVAAFERGTNALNNVYVQPVKTWQDWKQMVSQLCKKPELKTKFVTVAIDTVDEAWALCEKKICADNGIDTLGELGWGLGWRLAKQEFASTFRELAYSGYGLVFISHSVDKEEENDNGEKHNKIMPALPATPFGVINKMVDLIGYIREINIGTAENPQRERFVFFRDEKGDRYLVKSRYKYIKPRIKLDYDEFVNTIYEAIDAEVEHSGGSAVDTNPQIEKSFDELMEDARILWTTLVNKKLTDKASAILEKEFGKPIKFSEILPEQIEQLNHVLVEIQSII